jgi:phage terminase Nu1 subunit (DNA packaging protein)
MQLEEQGELTHLTEEIQRLGKEIDEAFANVNNKKQRRYKKILNSDG